MKPQSKSSSYYPIHSDFIKNGANSYADTSSFGLNKLQQIQVYYASLSYDFFFQERGKRHYELTNHLGNVLTVISDKRILVCNADTVTYSNASIISATDYSPFGAPLAGRTFSSESYSYRFNGKEQDNETYGDGNALDFGARIYDSRLGRWMSVDPLFKLYIPISPFSFGLNNPLYFIDKDGNVILDANKKPVTFSTPTKNEDGTYSTNFAFEPGTSEEVKAEFMINGGRIINTMIQIEKGREVAEKMQTCKESIQIEISQKEKLDEFGNPLLGATESIGLKLNADNPEMVEGEELRLTIYENTIKNVDKNQTTEIAKIWANGNMNLEQIIGSVSVHEGTHATKHFYFGIDFSLNQARKEDKAKIQEYKAIDQFIEINKNATK